MIRKTIIFLFLSIGISLNAQNQIIDSLKMALKNAKHDTTRAKIYLVWGEQIYSSVPDSASILWENSKSIAELNLKKLPATASEYIVFKKLLANNLNNFGFLAYQKGEIPRALEYFSKNIKVYEEIRMPDGRLGDKDGIAITLNNLGMIYQDQGDTPKALECLGKSLKIREEKGDKQTVAILLNNIGGIYEMQMDVKNAFEYYSKSLKIREELGNKRGIAYSLHSIGGVYYKAGDMPKALSYYVKSLLIFDEIGNKQGAAGASENIGGVYFKQKNYSKALEYVNRSMDISKELGYPENIRNAAKRLSQIHKAAGNHKLALENFELHIQMRDSINNESTRKASIKNQLKYEYEKQAAADSVAHAKESEIKNVELKRQEAEIKAKKNQQYALFGGLGLVMIFAAFMYNRFKVTQKQKGIIEKQKAVVEEQKHLVEEKQKEILDSIYYAKKIQMAQIPGEKRVQTILDKLRR